MFQEYTLKNENEFKSTIQIQYFSKKLLLMSMNGTLFFKDADY